MSTLSKQRRKYVCYFSGLRGNDTHQIIAKKDDDTLILWALDDESQIEISREQLGVSLKDSSSDVLVSLGVRVLLVAGSWEIASLNP